MHYGKVDFTTNSIKFPLSRPCNAGEQCFLGYGNFSSSHLLTFYGFLPQLDNYYDVIPLGKFLYGEISSYPSTINSLVRIKQGLVCVADIDVESNEGFADTGPTSDWTSHMIRGTWFSKNRGFFRYGLPPSLLDHMRRSRNPFLQTFNLVIPHKFLCYHFSLPCIPCLTFFSIFTISFSSS